MVAPQELPNGSIYLWMWNQGLRGCDYADVESLCSSAGIEIRAKDRENFWNGWTKHQINACTSILDCIPSDRIPNTTRHGVLKLCEYPLHPWPEAPEPLSRWVACDYRNMPMIRWGNGCETLAEAKARKGCKYLGENMKGTKRIVIDVDGDHGDSLDVDIIRFFSYWNDKTHVLAKPLTAGEVGCHDLLSDQSVSFHLTFRTDRVIPTMHFPVAHVDIIGNEMNSLRYRKNKIWNGQEPMDMDEETWSTIIDFIMEMERR